MCFHFGRTTRIFPGIWVQLQADGWGVGGCWWWRRRESQTETSQSHCGCAPSYGVPSPCLVTAAKTSQMMWITGVEGVEVNT